MSPLLVKNCKDFATIWTTIDPIGHPVPVRAANAFRATGFQPRIARAGARPGGVSAGGAFHSGTGRHNGRDPHLRITSFIPKTQKDAAAPPCFRGPRGRHFSFVFLQSPSVPVTTNDRRP